MADVTKSLTIQSAVEGAAEAVNTLNKIGDAAAKAGVKGKTLGDAINAGATKGRAGFLNLERAAAAQAARLDIAAKAQQRYNRELEAAGRFKNAGAIDENEYQKRIDLAKKQRDAMAGPSSGHGGGDAGGLNFMQKMESAHVLKSLADETIATGQPLRALALEGGRIAEIFGQSGGFSKAMTDAKTTLGNMIGPMTATKVILASVAGGALLAVGGFFAFKAIIDSAVEKMDELVKIGADASKAGVGTSFFQSWTKQAKELNLETTDLVAMLEKARQASTERISDADNKQIGNNISSSEGRSRIQQNVMAGNLNQSDLAAFKGADTQESKIRVVLNLIDELRQKGCAARGARSRQNVFRR